MPYTWAEFAVDFFFFVVNMVGVFMISGAIIVTIFAPVVFVVWLAIRAWRTLRP